ncbi:MAG: hypothetical protein R3217_10625, partial [Gammaproteobacteria bacterium]|nr:hypothetical protein [Gammaproteobacteria bacterium]
MSTAKLAILPMQDSSEKGDQGFVGDGIADELLHALSWAEGLRVAPLASSMRFKGPDLDLAEAAKALKAGYILTGKAHHQQGQLYLTAELRDMASGETLWTSSYERPVGDVGDVEDDILR